MTQESGPEFESVNEVRVVGRVSAMPEQREMPSGDELWSLRLVVPRAPSAGRQRVDVLECAVWAARPRRSVATWTEGDVVEVCGALRRRFFRTGGGSASRYEIEVSSARRLVRAVSRPRVSA